MSSIDFRLYLVSDRMQTRGRPLLSLLRDASCAGLPALQVRERDLSTRAVHDLVSAIQQVREGRRLAIMVNDRIDVVMALEADGVHLRADSLPTAVARRLLGPDRLLAVSTHSVEDVKRAAGEGADFVVFGPVYATPSKQTFGPPVGLHALEQAVSASRLPVFAIGGITRGRLGDVRRTGAHGVAVISSILAADNVADETRAFLQELNAWDHSPMRVT